MGVLVDTKEMFKEAYKNQYAIGAFNINNMEVIQGVMDAATKLCSPIILQASSHTQKYADLSYIVKIAEAAAQLSKVPVALHLDHGEDLDTVKEFIKAGFTSVMIDGSHLDYEKNVQLTKEVCEYAHEHGVVVEGELGVISGVEDGVSAEFGMYTKPEQVCDFVERTGIDSLAIAIGTSHGAYKFKPGQDPHLKFDILEEIGLLLPGFPIVLHGASSVNQEDISTINKFGGEIKAAIGIPEEMLRKAATMAVCKINVDTDIRLAMISAIRQQLHEEPGEIDYRKCIGAGRDLVSQRVAYKIKNIFNSVDRNS